MSFGGWTLYRFCRIGFGAGSTVEWHGMVDCRIQTGNLPSGIAMRQDGTRPTPTTKPTFSVTSMNVDDGLCLTLRRDTDSSEPPAPGSFEHAVLVGKLAFFTAFGIPDNDIFGTPIRDVVSSQLQEQDVKRRLEHLRIVPARRSRRRRHLVFWHRTEADNPAGRDVLRLITSGVSRILSTRFVATVASVSAASPSLAQHD